MGFTERACGTVIAASLLTLACHAKVVSNVAVPSPAPPSPPAIGSSCASEPMRSTGTVHYFCDCKTGAAAGCVAGSDSNNGLSPSTPRQNFSTAAALFNTMPGGDTIALCQGGSFAAYYTDSETKSAHNAKCSPSATCDIRNYAAPWNVGGEANPAIYGGTMGLDFDEPSNTAAYGGYRAFNLQITGFSQFGIMIGHRTSNVDLCNLQIHDGANYTTSNTGGGGYILQAGLVSNVTLRQSSLYNLGGQGWLGACSNFTITDNYFANIGGSRAGSSPQMHMVYLGSDETGVPSGVTIANNEFHAIVGGGGPVAVLAHLRVDNMLWENNIIYGAGDGYGLQIDQGDEGTAEGFNYAIVRRNQILNAGEVGIQIDQCPNCLVEDNVVVMGGNGGIGIASGQTPDVGNDLHNQNVVYRNNTIMFPPGVSGAGISLGGDGNTHVITNNVILKQGSGTLTCIDTPLPSSSYQKISNNACYGYSSWGTSYDSNRVTASPGFTNPAAAPPDFSFPSGSPLQNAGTSASTCTILGVANQPCYSPVAIGAFPWSAAATAKNRTDGSPDIGAYER